MLKLLLLLVLCLLPTLGTFADMAEAATSGRRPTGATATPAPTRRPAATRPAAPAAPGDRQASAPAPAADRQVASCDALLKDFEALRSDAKKGASRDAWLGLEDKFAALATKAGDETTGRALFYAARSREELAVRSGSGGDALEAVKDFSNMAKELPGHTLAPESKYRQAALLAGPRLNRPEEAKAALDELQKNWPNSRAAKPGKALAQRLERAAAAPTTAEAAGDEGQGRAQPAGGERQGRGQASGRRAAGGARASGDVLEQLGLGVHTVIIDPGHGGKDPGTMHGKLVESTLTLAMAKRVGALLEKKGIKVIYTRSGNQYIALEERTQKANEIKADLFISLHYNANNNTAVSGLEIYYLNMAQSADAAKVAARENAVSTKNVSDLQFIITDFMLDAKLEESRELAGAVRRGIIAKLKAAGRPFHDNGVRSAPFYVLMGARMPAVLVEFGYITNPDDSDKIANADFCLKQAEGLVEGILAYRDALAKQAAGK